MKKAADAKPGSGRKLTHNLTALSSAAVLAVYGAGYMRTRAAAEKFADDAVPRRAPEFESGAGRLGGPAPQTAAAAPSLRPLASTATVSGVEVSGPASTTAHERPVAGVSARPDSAPAPTIDAAAASPVVAASPAPAATSAAPSTSASAAPLSVQAQPAAAEQAAPAAQPAAALAQPVVQSAAVAPAAVPAPPAPRFKDGSYKGWGTSRHGDIEATVTVTGGRIESAVISQCLTRYSCSWISPLPPQVPARQSPEVDFVSGATQSTYAFYYAVIEALKQAK